MVRAEQLCMPLLVVNMGGEMLYILEQRLTAQSIANDKAIRVLQDVVSTMFSVKFVTELFRPQKVYSTPSVRQIFDRLAHSSIMRLNATSMEKLFDLMTMGFKYQLMLSLPDQLVQVSLNHLDYLTMRAVDPAVLELIANCRRQIVAAYQPLTTAECIILRQTLARFFQVSISFECRTHARAY
jgi:hypothetical protein